MAGGFTRIPKLKTDLGTEGTGDRIALYNSGGELVGYMMATDGFVPLSGTEVDKPITGDFEVDSDFKYFFEDENSLYQIQISNDDAWILLRAENKTTGDSSQITFEQGSIQITANYEGVGKSVIFNSVYGFIYSSVYNKQNNPNALAQLGDIAEENKTLTPLSLSDLNTEYPTQPTGFQVICNAISLIYIKRTLDTWESITTTTVV